MNIIYFEVVDMYMLRMLVWNIWLVDSKVTILLVRTIYMKWI